MTTSRKHHYISQGYLKRWATTGKSVWIYRTLVSHDDVPIWKKKSIAGIGFRLHLFTESTPKGESDEMERWFGREFESPAEEALQRALKGERMTVEDWRRLVRFAAAHDLRSPARFEEDMSRWQQDVPRTVEETVREVVSMLEAATPAALPTDAIRQPEELVGQSTSRLPIKVSIESPPGSDQAYVRAEIAVGRQLWLSQMRRLLTVTLPKVPIRGWSIVEPAEGFEWPTSDHPLIRLNFFNESNYDFRGGWNNPGSEILFPLSPRHLLYRQAQRPRPPRGTVFSHAQTSLVRRLITEHAHHFIIAAKPDDCLAEYRPRVVDDVRFRAEEEKWRQWHEAEAQIEREFWRIK